MPDPDLAGLIHEKVLDGVSDGEGRGLAAERVEDLDLSGVLEAAVARRGDHEPAVGQASEMRPAGAHGVEFRAFDVAVRMDGDDQGVERRDIGAGLRDAFGKQPVSGAENVDGAGQDVELVVRSGKTGVGDEGGLLHGRALLDRRSRPSGAAVSDGGGARSVESGAGRLAGIALSGRHAVSIVEVEPRDKPFLKTCHSCSSTAARGSGVRRAAPGREGQG
ncbi:hypothetical protein, partial [Streptomyces sp. NPDC057403]|uniref:hypothetical protein n=1 Tax=Streptomyces sp. NPDC057403 TaxID=3346119 RepID=UPI0036C18B09